MIGIPMPLSLPNGAADQLRRAGKPQDDLPPPHHLFHPFLPDVGVHRGSADGLVAQQGLDVHPFSPDVAQVRRVSMAQWVGGDFLLDPRRLQHPPQIGPVEAKLQFDDI